ncbi:hypothetical protein FKP32DRAFT_1601620 [Trametes sanguinea]|nr:hypothetical protein FKP32DRAFT_1601620 [Trametes sanguinea]
MPGALPLIGTFARVPCAASPSAYRLRYAYSRRNEAEAEVKYHHACENARSSRHDARTSGLTLAAEFQSSLGKQSEGRIFPGLESSQVQFPCTSLVTDPDRVVRPLWGEVLPATVETRTCSPVGDCFPDQQNTY